MKTKNVFDQNIAIQNDSIFSGAGNFIYQEKNSPLVRSRDPLLSSDSFIISNSSDHLINKNLKLFKTSQLDDCISNGPECSMVTENVCQKKLDFDDHKNTEHFSDTESVTNPAKKKKIKRLP